jgi:hypothetical protein
VAGARWQKGNKASKQLAAIDQLLIAGIKQGPGKKRQAINRILELVPEWTRGDCWKRIRHLRKTLELAALAKRHTEKAKRSEKSDPIRQSSRARWTPADDELLFRLAGYEPVRKIAQRLGRSARGVRFRLGALGMSAKVTDGWSLRALRKLLRVSQARLIYLIGQGILKVRDARVTAESLAAYRDKNCSSLDPAARERVTSVLANAEEAFSWERTADILGLTLAQVQDLISAGQLKLVDLFVTDRSFEEFCKKHGNLINMALIDPPTAKWLVSEYGVTETATNAVSISRARKHATIVRTCQCGRKIAGNPYFRHIRTCRSAGAAARGNSSNVVKSSNRTLTRAQSFRST